MNTDNYDISPFFQFSEDILCIAGLDGSFKKVSQSMTSHLGFTREELLSNPFWDIIHTESVETAEQKIGLLVKGQASVNFKGRFLCKDGTTKWMDWHVSLIKENLLYAIGRDITDERRKEFMFEATQKMGKIGSWELDLKTNSPFWSSEVYAIHEVPLDERVPTEEAINFYHPDYRELISEYIGKAISEGESFDDELQLITAKNNTIWVRAIGEPVIEDGKTVMLRGVFQDISKRKREEKIKEKQSKDLQLFMEAMPDLYIRCDKNYIVLDAKLGSRFVPLIDTQKLLNCSLAEELPPSVAQKIIPLIDNVFEEEKEQRLEFTVIKNGLEQVNEARFIPSVKNQVVGIIRDITELRKREETLSRLNQELERSNQELEEFAYIASHDLQEPLRKVTMFGSRIVERETDNLSERGLDYLNRMVSGTNRMQKLIDDLLSYSRVMGIQKNLEEVDLNDLLKDISDDFSLKLEALSGEIEIGPLPSIIANKVAVFQLFQNLISNAIKFRREEEPIKIQILSEQKQDNYHIFVRDNGIGLNNDYAKQIFQPFKRLHNKTKYEGTGIGLAICQKIVGQLGGTIKASGELGKGTSIEILLPQKVPH